MDVSLEAYRNIVRNVGRRRDIAALCAVSRSFQRAAERALYNTLTVSDVDPRVCTTLAGSPRIAELVVALTVQVNRRATLEDEEEGEEEEADEDQSQDRASAAKSAHSRTAISRIGGDESVDAYWSAVAGVLRNTTRLRHLTVDIGDLADAASAWVLDRCVFQLRTFHCDFDWDHSLHAFLATQGAIRDLSLRDYRDLAAPDVPDDGQTNAPSVETQDPTDAAQHTLESDIPADTIDTTHPETLPAPAPTTTIATRTTNTTPPQQQPTPAPALPLLETLECTFSEAAVALIPGRPLTRLKTCFSRPDPSGKHEELVALLAALRLSAYPIRALDIADAAYTESGAMELLHRISHTQATSCELRYFGTLVLPVGGRKRLHFYGLLMRLRRLRCIEVDVSAWTPPPSSSPAFRAVAAELRLYCPDVTTVVFVHEYERTVVTAVAGVLRIDAADPEHFWREI